MTLSSILYRRLLPSIGCLAISVGAYRNFASNESMANSGKEWKSATSIFDFTVKDIHGKDVPLKNYEGFVSVIVNVASKWGLTDKNYTELEQLYEKYSQQGLRILAFPCNQFNNQEPGTNEEIEKFAREKYNAKFDLFSKIEVNGDNAIPLYKFLKKHKNTTGTLTNAIKWNFTKFLVDKQGIPKKRFAPQAGPLSMQDDIKKLL